MLRLAIKKGMLEFLCKVNFPELLRKMHHSVFQNTYWKNDWYFNPGYYQIVIRKNVSQLKIGTPFTSPCF
jgi:hypothetical protein